MIFVTGTDPGLLPFIQKPNLAWDFWGLSGAQWAYLGRGPKEDLITHGAGDSPRARIEGASLYTFAMPASVNQATDPAYRLDSQGRPAQGATVPVTSTPPAPSFDVWALSGTPQTLAYLGRGTLDELELSGFAQARLDPLGQPIVLRPSGLILPAQPGYRLDAQGRPL